MEPMCCYSIKMYSNTISSHYWKSDSVIGRILRVISTIRFYLILCIVKQYKWQFRRLREMATTSKIRSRRTVLKSTIHSFNGQKLPTEYTKEITTLNLR